VAPARSAVILASRSPQRRAILEQLGVEFSMQVPDVSELESGPPHEVAIENAYRKAAAIAGGGEAGGAGVGAAIVLGVDTVVCLGSRIYGKPADETKARETLLALANRVHTVISGICVIEREEPRTAASSTRVEFRRLDEGLLEWYLVAGEWRERAGAYAIQGRGAALITRIEGDYTNVVGLPVPTLLDLVPGLLGG
jgi:septum formation protein